jgi:hypothetical protein
MNNAAPNTQPPAPEEWAVVEAIKACYGESREYHLEEWKTDSLFFQKIVNRTALRFMQLTEEHAGAIDAKNTELPFCDCALLIRNLHTNNYHMQNEPRALRHDEFLIDSPNPDALDQTLQALPMAGARLVKDAPTLAGNPPSYEQIDGHYIVRASNVDYAKFSCKNQGYGKVVDP